MKAITILAASLISAIATAQIAGTSFEEPDVFSVEYVDTGDPNIAHDLVNNPDEPYVDFPESNGLLGFDARYEPYDTPGTGQTDGDFVGVTDATTTVGAYTDGVQGYQISDADGNFILEFDQVDLTSASSPMVSIDYYISDTGYEGDGTVNESGSDRLRIYVRDLTNSTETDILNTTGSDINDLEIQGLWINGSAELLPDTLVQLVIEARCNSGAESFFFDNVVFSGTLGSPLNEKKLFTVTPNPVSDGQVSIYSGNSDPVKVEIYDVLGNLMIHSQNHGSKLDISGLYSGIYILRLSQGNTVQTQKLVIR